MRNRSQLFKKLTSSFLVALGFMLDTEVFAEYRSSNIATSYATHSNVIDNIHYVPQLNLGGFYGSPGQSYGEGDFWLPLAQSWDQVFYADVRFQKNEGNTWDSALGLGYRWLSDDVERLYDIYSFYNTYQSAYQNQYQQIVLGASFRTLNWTLRGNYYHSLGTTSYATPSLDDINLVYLGGIQYQPYISYAYEDNFVSGGVAEVGRTVPYTRGLSLFAGYYYFAASDAYPAIQGARGRLEYKLDELFNAKSSFFRHITLEGLIQHDNVNKIMWTAGLRLSIPLGRSTTGSPLQDAMMDYVHFYPRMVQATTIKKDYVPYTMNGQNVIFDKVTTGTEFNTAASDNSSVVVVMNDIQLNETVLLNNNKYVTGQNFEYSPGHFLNITDKSTIPTITGALVNGQPQWLLSVQQNNTIRDINLQTQPSPNGQALSFVITNNLSSVGALTIADITTNGAINIQVSNNASPSVISITDSNFTPTDAIGAPGSPTTPIFISATNGASVVINNIDNNAMLFLTTPKSVFYDGLAYQQGISLTTDNNATTSMTINSVSGNNITFGDNASALGIYIANFSHQTVVNINNNQITFGNNATLSNGQFGSLSDVGGIVIYNAGNQNQQTGLMSVSNNQIIFGQNATINASASGLDAHLSGIDISNESNGTGVQTVGLVEGNTITFGDGANVTGDQALSGIRIFTNGSSQSINSINSNIINFGSASAVNTSEGTAILSGINIGLNNSSLSQQFALVNNNVSLGGAQTNTLGYFINNLSNNGTVNITDFYNNNISGNVKIAQVNNSNQGSINIKINDPKGASTLGAANNSIEFQLGGNNSGNIQVTP